jgi:hypothetical protein
MSPSDDKSADQAFRILVMAWIFMLGSVVLYALLIVFLKNRITPVLPEHTESVRNILYFIAQWNLAWCLPYSGISCGES